MARISTVTFAQVATIADTMTAAGLRPTARAVRERLGTGSMGTIHKLIQQWAGKGSADDEAEDAPELPASIASVLMDFVSTQVAEACEPLAEELREAKAAALELAEENERLCREVERLAEEVRTREIDHAQALATLTAATAAGDKARQDAELARSREADLVRELDRMGMKLEDLERTRDELKDVRASLDGERQAGAKTAQALAVAEAKLVHALGDLDGARKYGQDLERQVGKLQDMAFQAQAEKAQLQAETASLKGKLELMASQAQAQAPAEKPQPVAEAAPAKSRKASHVDKP